MRTPPIAPLIARRIIAVVLIGFCLVAILHVVYQGGSIVSIGLAVVYLVALLLLQLLVISRRYALYSRWKIPFLLAQAALVFLPVLQFGPAWVGLPGFVAGSALLALRPVAGWSAFGLVAVAASVIQFTLTGDALDVTYTAISTVITGLVVYGLSRLAAVVTDLHRAREELARAAVVRERLRFSRDIHDMLGYRLSALTLKSELVCRLVVDDPRRAVDEMNGVHDLARRSLAEIRFVAAGYRYYSLEDELASVRSVLTAASVSFDVEGSEQDVPPEIAALFAAILREATVNLLRHSKATWCRVVIETEADVSRLEVTNDGLPDEPVAARPDSSGLEGMNDRARAFGGWVKHHVEQDDLFVLAVTVPVGSDPRMPS